MIGTLLSVDFVHPDCDETQMVLHIRTPSGGIVGGDLEVRYPSDNSDDLRDTLRAMTRALTGTDDESIQRRLFDLAGHKPSHYCACIRRSLEKLVKIAAKREPVADADISFPAALLGIECPPIKSDWQELRDSILHAPDMDSDIINWALGLVDSFAPLGSLE